MMRALPRLATLTATLTTALFVTGCPDPVEPDDDAGVALDAEPRDAGEDPPVDAGEDPPVDAGVADAGFVDAGAPDSGVMDAGFPDSGPRVVPIRVAYAATVQDPLLADLFLTESSTTRAQVNPTLAGGPTMGGKGEPVIAGVDAFAWTPEGNLVYEAQQDTFDRYEIYLAVQPGSQQIQKLSLPNAAEAARGFTLSPRRDWVTFTQVPAGESRNRLFAIRPLPGAAAVQIGQGTSGVPTWSPVDDEVAFQDILAARDDRDLWHVNLAASPPARTRAHSGANVGFGGAVSWSGDGTRLAFSADDDVSRVFEPYQVRVRAGMLFATTRLTQAFPAAADVVFGRDSIQYDPTSTQLAFLADLETDQVDELFVLDPTRTLPATPTKLNATFPARAGGVETFVWSSDGTRIAYVGDQATAGRPALYLTDASAPTGVRLDTPVTTDDASIEQPRFIRGDTAVLYLQREGQVRRLHVVDVSGPNPGAPVDLGGAEPFFSENRYALSPSEDYVVFPNDQPPAGLSLARLTGTPTVTATFETAVDTSFAGYTNWCWGPADELLIIGADGRLYLVEDLDTGATFPISGPLADGGRVTACAFPPARPN